MALLFVVTLVLVRLAYVFCVERASLSAFTCIHLLRIGHGGTKVSSLSGMEETFLYSSRSARLDVPPAGGTSRAEYKLSRPRSKIA